MLKQIDRQLRDLQRELILLQKEGEILRLQPCRGDTDIAQKEEKRSVLEKKVSVIKERIRELEKKKREMLSEIVRKDGYESPLP